MSVSQVQDSQTALPEVARFFEDLDGLDLVYVKLSKAISWDYEILAAKTYGYSPTWFSKLGNAINLSDIKLAELNKDYSNFLADQILHFIKEFNIIKIEI